jgi:predicted MFS family arabinose efflux permease
MKPAALNSRDFRLYWFALIISAIGTWMQIVAQSLLVLQLSHGNAASLGFVALAQASAFFLFALFGGSVADRIDRRRLLLLTQSVLMVVAFLIGVLVARQMIHVWMIVFAAFLSGVVLSFDQPARSAFLPSLVPEPDLASAISLQSTVFTGAAALAPALAGLSVARFGLAGNFFFNAASYLAVIFALLSLRSGATSESGRPVRLWQSIQEGIETVRGDRGLTWAVSGYALLLFAAPSMQILLPVIANRVFDASATWLGLFFAAFGTGTIGGALLIPWLAGFGRINRIYLGAFTVWVGALSMVAYTHRIGVFLGALLFLGGAQNAISTLTITLLQSRVAKTMRGRMMSLQTVLNMGVRPLGDFPLSILIARLGAPAAAGLSAALIGAYSIYLASTSKRSWQAPAVYRVPK